MSVAKQRQSPHTQYSVVLPPRVEHAVMHAKIQIHREARSTMISEQVALFANNSINRLTKLVNPLDLTQPYDIQIVPLEIAARSSRTCAGRIFTANSYTVRIIVIVSTATVFVSL